MSPQLGLLVNQRYGKNSSTIDKVSWHEDISPKEVVLIALCSFDERADPVHEVTFLPYPSLAEEVEDYDNRNSNYDDKRRKGYFVASIDPFILRVTLKLFHIHEGKQEKLKVELHEDTN